MRTLITVAHARLIAALPNSSPSIRFLFKTTPHASSLRSSNRFVSFLQAKSKTPQKSALRMIKPLPLPVAATAPLFPPPFTAPAAFLSFAGPSNPAKSNKL